MKKILLLLILVCVTVVSQFTEAQTIPPAPQPALNWMFVYGTASIGGNPAPVGTTIFAIVNNQVRGSITLTQSGTFGDPQNNQIRELEITGAANETVGFIATNGQNNVTASQTIPFNGSTTVQVTLSFPSFPSSPPSPIGSTGGGSSGGGGGGGGGGLVTSPPANQQSNQSQSPPVSPPSQPQQPEQPPAPPVPQPPSVSEQVEPSPPAPAGFDITGFFTGLSTPTRAFSIIAIVIIILGLLIYWKASD